jgi:hypothetical protein
LPGPAPVDLQLSAQGPAIELTITPAAGAPARLSGYVAVVEDGLTSRPAAGENRGATLREDGIVQELLPWVAASAAPQTLRFTSSSSPESGATRRYIAVATTEDGGKPLQAVALACAR